MATRKRGFRFSADRAAAELAQPVKIVNPGRGKKIAIAVAAVIAIAAVVLFAFGRDMLGGLLGEPPAAAPAVASSPAAPAQSLAAPGARAGSSRGAATTVANPSPATPHATFQTSVTPASAKPDHQKAAAEPAAAPKAADASVGALPVPTVNVDAATHSIDEATKSTGQKPKVKIPF